jgi:hypothetical protein
VGVLVSLAEDDFLQVNDVDRGLGPTELFQGLQPTSARNQCPVGRDHDRVQRADLVDAGGQGRDAPVRPGVPAAAPHPLQ